MKWKIIVTGEKGEPCLCKNDTTGECFAEEHYLYCPGLGNPGCPAKPEEG